MSNRTIIFRVFLFVLAAVAAFMFFASQRLKQEKQNEKLYKRFDADSVRAEKIINYCDCQNKIYLSEWRHRIDSMQLKAAMIAINFAGTGNKKYSNQYHKFSDTIRAEIVRYNIAIDSIQKIKP